MSAAVHWCRIPFRSLLVKVVARPLSILFPALLLAACSMPVREGPPAPVVQVSPRASTPSTQPPLPEVESEPAPKPAAPPKPAKPQTKVYAYRDPAAPPEPEPVQPEQTAETATQPRAAAPETAPVRKSPPESGPPRTAVQAPAAPSQKSAAETQSAGAPPTQQVVAKAEPPKPKPKPKPPEPPIMGPPASETPTSPPVSATAPPEPAPESVALPASNVAAPSLPPAAQALATQAEKQRQAGDYTGAAASLERSLRIAPREAYLWNRLARVRMEQGQTAQAGNLASRSNDLAGNSGDVKKDNYRMIAEAKRRAGDAAGASEAEQRANAD